MDNFDRGFITNGNIYFTDNPVQRLPMKVISVKIMSFAMYIIDEENNLWYGYVTTNSEGNFDEYGDVIMVLEFELLIYEVKVADICEYGQDLIILSKEGELYSMNNPKGRGSLEKIDIDAKFVSINSEGESMLGGAVAIVAIDTRGNLWSNQINFIEDEQGYLNHVQRIDLQQRTQDIYFEQAEYGNKNLMCLDNEGDLYCVGKNTSNDLIVDEENVNQLTKILFPTKFRKIFKTREYTALIDVDNSLWICGKHFSYIQMLDRMGVPISQRDYNTPRKILENVDSVSGSIDHTLVKLLDGTLMIDTADQIIRNADHIPGTYLILEDMTADKLFNHIDRPVVRFFRTKSARKQ